MVGKPRHRSIVLDEEDRYRLTQAQLRAYRADIQHTMAKQAYLSNHAQESLGRGLTAYDAKVAAYRAAGTPADKERLGKEVVNFEKKLTEQIDHALSGRAGLSRTTRKNLAATLSESILFGLMLFSIVLMLSSPEITGFAILNMPLIINIPFVLGAALFVLDLILIERWFRRR